MTLLFPGADEAVELARRRAVAYGQSFDEALVDEYRRLASEGLIAAVAVGDRIVAQCRLLPADHWFGGRRVATLNVASFAVAPEDRGQGHARRLIAEIVRHGDERGIGLSLLFPATTRLYRSSGWEIAGELARFEVDARSVPGTGPLLRRGGDGADWAAIRRCYDRACRSQNGPAARTEERWARLAGAAYRYVLDGAGGNTPAGVRGELDAYVLVDHARSSGHWQHRLVLVDWSATSADGFAAIAAFVGREGTIGRDATYTAPAGGLWDLHLPEQSAKRTGGLYWMARGLDLAAAVSARGYPRPVTGSLTVRVEDPLLPRWAAPHLLEIAGGEGRLTPAGDGVSTSGGEVVADPRAVGPLFTGLLDPSTLSVAGLLRGPEEAFDLLRAAFAGPRPTLPDFF